MQPDAWLTVFAEHGDIGHLALLFWASMATGLLLWTMRELVAANRRFEEFVEAIARLNALFHDRVDD